MLSNRANQKSNNRGPFLGYHDRPTPPPANRHRHLYTCVGSQRHTSIQRDTGTHAGPHRHTIQIHTHSCRYTQTQIPRYSHRHKYSNRYTQTDMHIGTHIQMHTNQVGMHIMLCFLSCSFIGLLISWFYIYNLNNKTDIKSLRRSLSIISKAA